MQIKSKKLLNTVIPSFLKRERERTRTFSTIRSKELLRYDSGVPVPFLTVTMTVFEDLKRSGTVKNDHGNGQER